MSAVTRTRPAPAPDTVAGPVTQVRVVRAEWTKLRALRTTWWCALIAVVLIVGLGAAIAGSGAPYKISAGNSAAGGVTLSVEPFLDEKSRSADDKGSLDATKQQLAKIKESTVKSANETGTIFREK